MRLIAVLSLYVVFCSSVQAQSNDSFESRLTLGGTNPTAVSNNLRATRQTGEPNHAGASAGRSLWWTWTATTTGTINIGTYYAGTNLPLLRAIGIYTGDAVGALTEVASSNNQAQASYPQFAYPLSAMGTSINVPVTTGTVYQIAVDALASPRLPDDGTVVLAINAVPTILSAANTTATSGASFVYTITATGGPTVFAAANLPTGLVLNATTGQITGTPAAAGTYNIGLSATGPGGTGTAALVLRVSDSVPAAPSVPVVTNAASTRGFVGTAFSLSISASGSPTSYTATNLPSGLSLNAQTGVISGALGTTAVVGVPFQYTVQASNAPTSYKVGTLPAGLQFNASTGVVSGTPTGTGTYPVSVSATNGSGTASAVITYVVSALALAPPVIAYLDAGLAGFVGVPISTISLSATNAPMSYAASNLPPGLVLNTANGQISGTPTTAGTYTVNLSATNAAGTGTAVWQVVINDGSVLSPVFSSTAAQFSGTVGQSNYYSFYAYSYYGGSSTSANTTITVAGLPTGVQVCSSSANYLELSGTPVTAGTYPLTFTATSPGGATATMIGTLVVAPAPAPTISSAAGALGNVNNAFSYSLYASNTVTTYNVGTLPAGLTLNSSTGQITGTPTSTGLPLCR